MACGCCYSPHPVRVVSWWRKPKLFQLWASEALRRVNPSPVVRHNFVLLRWSPKRGGILVFFWGILAVSSSSAVILVFLWVCPCFSEGLLVNQCFSRDPLEGILFFQWGILPFYGVSRLRGGIFRILLTGYPLGALLLLSRNIDSQLQGLEFLGWP